MNCEAIHRPTHAKVSRRFAAPRDENPWTVRTKGFHFAWLRGLELHQCLKVMSLPRYYSSTPQCCDTLPQNMHRWQPAQECTRSHVWYNTTHAIHKNSCHYSSCRASRNSVFCRARGSPSQRTGAGKTRCADIRVTRLRGSWPTMSGIKTIT
jgi:hypothetical protein